MQTYCIHLNMKKPRDRAKITRQIFKILQNYRERKNAKKTNIDFKTIRSLFKLALSGVTLKIFYLLWVG